MDRNVCYDQQHRSEAVRIYRGTTPTITARCGTGGNNVPLVMDKCYCLQGNMIGRADKNGPQGSGVNEDVSFTLNTTDKHGVTYAMTTGNFTQIEKEKTPTLMALDYKDPNVINQRYIVRRLTVLECERLQGLPEGWTDVPSIDKNGKVKPASDSARYKAIGNGMAQPCADYVIAQIVKATKEVK